MRDKADKRVKHTQRVTLGFKLAVVDITKTSNRTSAGITTID